MLSILTSTTLALQFFLVSSTFVPRWHISRCKVKHSVELMNLPASLPPPTTPFSYVAVAIGTQNYTCSDAGNYTNIGAVAELVDISCLTGSRDTFDKIADVAIEAWTAAPPESSTHQALAALGIIDPRLFLGPHIFVPNSVTGQGISPKWDFTESEHNNTAFVEAAKDVGVPAVTGHQDVDWLKLHGIAGKLADEVYRTDTRLGQPPAGGCTPGSAPITVKYASKYWFFGGNTAHFA